MACSSAQQFCVVRAPQRLARQDLPRSHQPPLQQDRALQPVEKAGSQLVQNATDTLLICQTSLWLTTSASPGAAPLLSSTTRKSQTWWPAYTPTPGRGYWIGAMNWLDEGKFSWVDGTWIDATRSGTGLAGYSNWKNNQPNNGLINQHCVYQRDDGFWDDITCKREENYVCQKVL